VEGPTGDAEVLELRARQQRNFLATMFLSQGVPMLLGGDEMGRTQGGNNNGYCQDNEVSWFDWAGADHTLLDFSRWLVQFRRDHPIFRRRRWFQGRPIRGRGLVDIAWFRPDGEEMSDDDWQEPATTLGMFLNGQAIASPDSRGEHVFDDSFIVLFSAHFEPVGFTLPALWGERWEVVLDTADTFIPEQHPDIEPPVHKAGAAVEVTSRSLVLLRRLG
jgi:glycogen operon protein